MAFHNKPLPPTHTHSHAHTTSSSIQVKHPGNCPPWELSDPGCFHVVIRKLPGGLTTYVSQAESGVCHFAPISWAETSHTILPTCMGKWKIGEAYG